MAKRSGRTLSRRGLLTGKWREHLYPEFNAPSEAYQAKTPTPEGDDESLTQANTAYDKGEWSQAATLYRRYLRLERQDYAARKRLGYCLYLLGQYVQAKVEFERVLKIVEEDNYAFLYLGLCCMRMDKPERAVEAWKLYFNPAALGLQRELNIQIGLIESAEPDERPQPIEVIAAVEAAIASDEPHQDTQSA